MASSTRAQLLTPSGLRMDSRLALELRSLSFEILPVPPTKSNPLSSSAPASANGYALVKHGLTQVSSSVLGPREGMRTGPFSGQGSGGAGAQQRGGTDKAVVNVEVGVAGWSERSQGANVPAGGVRRGGKDRRMVELAASVKATFEPVLLLHLYPRSSIDISIQVLVVDALVQAAINATTLALVSAGLPLSDYVCALSLASYPAIVPLAPVQKANFELLSPSAFDTTHNNAPEGTEGTTIVTGSGCTTIVDLTQAEESALPNLTVAVLPRSGKVTLVNLETRVGIARFEEMLRWGAEGSKVVQGAMEEAVRTWAKQLAAPSRHLGSLFPSVARNRSKAGADAMDI